MKLYLLAPAFASLACALIALFQLRILYTEPAPTRDMLVCLATLIVACTGLVIFTVLAFLP